MTPTIDQLTAYALGEGTAAERTAIEAHLATDPAARAEVAAIRDTARLLSDGLASEDAPGLDTGRRRALSSLDAPKRIRFPAWIAVVATGALAAGIAVAVMPMTAAPVSSAPMPVTAAEPLLAKREAVEQQRYAPAPAPVAMPMKAKEASAPAAPPAPAALAAPAEAGAAATNVQAFAAIEAPAEKPGAAAGLAAADAPAPVMAQRLAKTATLKDEVRHEADAADSRADAGAKAGAGSYDEVRRFLRAGRLPPADAVRTAELIGAFRYAEEAHPQVGACPWNAGHRLVRIGLPQPATAAAVRIAFNPATVAAWRPVDDEPRLRPLAEAGADLRQAGSPSTVLYEIEPPRAADEAAKADALRSSGWLLTVSRLERRPDGSLGASPPAPAADTGAPGDADTRFAAAVAEFAQCLRGQPGAWDLDRVLRTAQATAGSDAQRAEFIDLVRQAQRLRR